MTATVRRALAAGVLCLLAVGVLAAVVVSNRFWLDVHLHAYAVRHRAGSLGFARAVTRGGSWRIAWPCAAVAGLLMHVGPGLLRRLQVGGLMALAFIAGVDARLGLSDLVHRARPPRADWAGGAGGYAFPSGHTTAATLAAGLGAWAVARHVASYRWRVAAWVVAVGYAGLVGWSRMWIGVHWPTDVLGGWLFGAGWVALTYAAFTYVARRLASGPVPEVVEEAIGGQ